MGKVKRVRGVVYTARVSPAFANRMVESAKGVLLNFLPDVYIHTDHCKGDKAGKSPGKNMHKITNANSNYNFFLFF